MPTKVITVPQEKVEFEQESPLTLQMVKRKLDFKEFALICVRNYAFFGQGLENIMQGAEIIKAIKASDGTLDLGETDYGKFYKAVEARQWNQAAGEACIPFIVAAKDAKDKEEKK